jgi:hypothetical protein
MSGSELFATWIAAFLTICVLSFLYKDNPLFRFGESLFAGVSLGYFIGLVANQTLKPNLVGPIREGLAEHGAFGFFHHWHLLLAALLGIMLYARYIPSIAWISRWSLATYIGYYVGINMVQKLHGDVLPQTRNTLLPLADFDLGMVNNLIVGIGVLSVLVYFFFSLEHKGSVAGISRLGIWFLMVSFGAAFGYTVMGRVSLLIGRMDFMVNQWVMGTIAFFSGGG